MELKKITYDNVDYMYESVSELEDFNYGTYVYGSVPKIIYVRKYWLFGPLIQKEEYPYLFYFNIDIENEIYSKADVEKYFERELKKLNRKKEIENGNIL